jgi:hypothetical protein
MYLGWIMESVLDRLRPFVDTTIDRLRDLPFRADPIAGEKYSRVTSIMSSAYKRHGQILDRALLESLKDCSSFRVWREDEFKLSRQSLNELQTHQRIEKCMRIELEYGDRESATPIDILVFDQRNNSLQSYNVKRGNGSYDGSKRRVIQASLLRTNMLLLDYGKKAGLPVTNARANIIFYYGLLSIPKPLSLSGDELDTHFSFPVIESIEQVNAYFKQRLLSLVEEY